MPTAKRGFLPKVTPATGMIVALMGGVGNQLFQYAFGISVATVRKDAVGFTIHRCNHDKWRPAGYLLNGFVDDIKLLPASEENHPFFKDEGDAFGFQQGVYNREISTYVGYWQTEKYFNIGLVRHKVAYRYPLGDKSKEVAEAITKAGKASAFLHVRQGADYHRSDHHGLKTMSYYHQAVERVRQNYEGAQFFVFGDNPDWIRANFPAEGFTIVDHIKSDTNEIHEDMQLMSLCQNGAIANSSFSWWAAWLGEKPGSIIMAPKIWFGASGQANVYTDDIVPDRWIKLEG